MCRYSNVYIRFKYDVLCTVQYYKGIVVSFPYKKKLIVCDKFDTYFLYVVILFTLAQENLESTARGFLSKGRGRIMISLCEFLLYFSVLCIFPQ